MAEWRAYLSEQQPRLVAELLECLRIPSLYGGGIANPLHALAELLASLHTPDGKVAVSGFYDDVLPLGPGDRARFAAVPFDSARFAAELGVPEVFGEPGYTTYERLWSRPTLELVGIWGATRARAARPCCPGRPTPR